MSLDEEKVKETLEELLESAKTIEEVNEIKFLIEDYLEEGYNLKDYIVKYNLIVKKICTEDS